MSDILGKINGMPELRYGMTVFTAKTDIEAFKCALLTHVLEAVTSKHQVMFVGSAAMHHVARITVARAIAKTYNITLLHDVDETNVNIVWEYIEMKLGMHDIKPVENGKTLGADMVIELPETDEAAKTFAKEIQGTDESYRDTVAYGITCMCDDLYDPTPAWMEIPQVHFNVEDGRIDVHDANGTHSIKIRYYGGLLTEA